MKTPTFRTKCTVRLQKSTAGKNEYYLYIEAYPVFEDNSAKPMRKTTFLNRVVSSVMWDANGRWDYRYEITNENHLTMTLELGTAAVVIPRYKSIIYQRLNY